MIAGYMIRLVVGGQPLGQPRIRMLACKGHEMLFLLFIIDLLCNQSVRQRGGWVTWVLGQQHPSAAWVGVTTDANCCHGQHSFEEWLLAHV